MTISYVRFLRKICFEHKHISLVIDVDNQVCTRQINIAKKKQFQLDVIKK